MGNSGQQTKMIKAENKGGERNLRSASPHRNAYKSDFHAIKCTFDGPKSEVATKSYTNGSSDTREDSRGRPFGTRVNKIKNIFLQMDGQQQDGQEGKVTLKPEAPQVSPTKTQFQQTNAHRVNFSGTSADPHNLDKTPKGEDAEIDKVALAEKFSVTRKIFERGIREPPAAEKHSPSRVVTRLSLGSPTDEGKNTRKGSGGGSSEATTRSEQMPPAVEFRPDEKTDGEKRHTSSSRVALNSGPISKRLGNFLPDNESEDNGIATPKAENVSGKLRSPTERSLPTSPTRDTCCSSPSAKEATNSTPLTEATSKNGSQTACVTNKPPLGGSSSGLKPTFPVTSAASKSTADATNKAASPDQTASVGQGYRRLSSSVGGEEEEPQSPTARDVKQPPSSAANFQSVSKTKFSERTRSNDAVVHSPTKDKPLSQTSPPNSKGVAMVRAELVVVQNESSESDENEMDNVDGQVSGEPVEKRFDAPQTSLRRTFPLEQRDCNAAHHGAMDSQRIAETLGEGRLLEDNYQYVAQKEGKKDRSVVYKESKTNHEDDKEVGEEENEVEEQVGQSIPDRASPAVCGIENAAFVDDRDVDQVLREEEEDDEGEEEEDDDEMHGEYDVCYEAPGLSDEDDPPARRKICFSTDPIVVSPKLCAVYV